MTRVAVVLADGFEEIEALAPVDVFRRAHFDCQIVGLDSHEVEGSHGIRVQTDQVFDGDLSSFDRLFYQEECQVLFTLEIQSH